MCTDITCARCSISPGACALPLDVQGVYGTPQILLCWRSLLSGEMRGAPYLSAPPLDRRNTYTSESELCTWDEARGEWVALPAGEDTDTGTCGAGGDCGESAYWRPPYDPGQHPYRVALALLWARVILRDAPEDWRAVRANIRCARWYASRANLAHLRRWGRVSAPRWTSRHPHPLATV